MIKNIFKLPKVNLNPESGSWIESVYEPVLSISTKQIDFPHPINPAEFHLYKSVEEIILAGKICYTERLMLRNLENHYVPYKVKFMLYDNHTKELEHINNYCIIPNLKLIYNDIFDNTDCLMELNEIDISPYVNEFYNMTPPIQEEISQLLNDNNYIYTICSSKHVRNDHMTTPKFIDMTTRSCLMNRVSYLDINNINTDSNAIYRNMFNNDIDDIVVSCSDNYNPDSCFELADLTESLNVTDYELVFKHSFDNNTVFRDNHYDKFTWFNRYNLKNDKPPNINYVTLRSAIVKTIEMSHQFNHTGLFTIHVIKDFNDKIHIRIYDPVNHEIIDYLLIDLAILNLFPSALRISWT